jgi:hypothetical protein
MPVLYQGIYLNPSSRSPSEFLPDFPGSGELGH